MMFERPSDTPVIRFRDGGEVVKEIPLELCPTCGAALPYDWPEDLPKDRIYTVTMPAVTPPGGCRWLSTWLVPFGRRRG